VRFATRRADTVATLEEASSVAAREHAALFFMEEPFYLVERRRIASLALRHHVSTVFPFRDHVEAGGLASYGVNVQELYRRSADVVDRS
jgi:putative ABC transport system substrate-binding protein